MGFEIFLIVLGWLAVIGDFYVAASEGEFIVTIVGLITFLSFTTVLIFTVYFSYILFFNNRNSVINNRSATILGLTSYLVFVAIVHGFLFEESNAISIALAVDIIEHTVIPLFAFVYWLFFCNPVRVTFGLIGVTFLYPLLYLLVVLVNGLMTNKFPYYFLDASVLGWDDVLANLIFLNFGFLVIYLILLIAGNYMKRSRNFR